MELTKDYEIKVRAQHHRFAAGHRVRLRISGGSREARAAGPEPVELELGTVDSAQSRLPRLRRRTAVRKP